MKNLIIGIVGIGAVYTGYLYFRKPKITRSGIQRNEDGTYQIIVDVNGKNILNEKIQAKTDANGIIEPADFGMNNVKIPFSNYVADIRTKKKGEVSIEPLIVTFR